MDPQDPEERLDKTREQHEDYELDQLGTSSTRRDPADGDSTSSANAKSEKSIRSRLAVLIPVLSVPESAARDHLANERVLLAYIRTSSALANFAVVIVQLYRLKHDPPPPGVLSDYSFGVPLAVVTLIMAMVVSCVGAVRFFLCQKAMSEEKIVGSGTMVVGFGAGAALVSSPIGESDWPSTHSTLQQLLSTLFILTIIVNPNV